MEQLPDDAVYVRTTPMFTNGRVPAGLLADHQVAADAWAQLRVLTGKLVFRFNDEPNGRTLDPDHPQVIPPQRLHRLELIDQVEFEIDFYRANP